MMAWWVILILVGVQVLMLLANLRFIYYFMHVDDFKYNQGIFAQVVAVLGGQLVWLLFAIIPTDAYNMEYSGNLNMLYFWQMTYLFVTVYLIFLLPLGVFFYEADSDPRIAKTPPWRQAAWKTLYTFAGCSAIIGILYAICHKITVTREMEPDYVGPPIFDVIRLNFLTFLLALPGFFGWFLFAFQGGIGMVAIPMNLIMRWLKRPRPLSPGQYERHKKMLGERAKVLRGIGEGLRDKESGVAKKGGLSKTSARFGLRQKLGKYQQVVMLLEGEFEKLETSYKKRGANPLISLLTITLGVLATIMTLIWLIEILMTCLIPQLIKRNVKGNFLAEFLILSRKSHVLVPEIVIYGGFATYLIACGLVGGMKLNQRLQGCFPVEQLKKGDTHLNALLFHIAVLVMSACSVVELSERILGKYVADTEGEALFRLQRNNMTMISKFYGSDVFIWAFVIVTILAAVWLIAFPHDRPALDLDDPRILAKWAKLQKDLGVDENEAGAVQAPDAEDLAAVTANNTGLGAKAKAKMGRIDKGIENAPGHLMGAGVRNAFV